MSKSCHSFETMLRKWLRTIQPKSVLEWGPGRSTTIIQEECPNAEITSIENQICFVKKAVIEHPTVNIVYAPIPQYGPSDYSCWPLLFEKGKKYDLIFVDGRQRVSCLLTAREVLNKDGVVLLHDAQRLHYKHGIKLFDKVDDDGDTIALKLI